MRAAQSPPAPGGVTVPDFVIEGVLGGGDLASPSSLSHTSQKISRPTDELTASQTLLAAAAADHGLRVHH